jgi:DNA-directed RNA polymerase subunit RPC12/RpoP
MSLSNLRQGAMKVTSQANSGKGGGGKGGFFNKWRPPKLTDQLKAVLRPQEMAGDPIILVKPEQLYDDVYDTDDYGNPRGAKTEALHILLHQIKTLRNGKERFEEFVCTAGPNPHAPQPCIGEVCIDQGNTHVSPARQNWAFNIKHLVPYHEVPLIDKKTNTIVMKKDKNEPVLVLQQCEIGTPDMKSRHYNYQTREFTCQYCASNMPFVFGAPKVYQLGKKHLEELLKTSEQVETTCAHCMTHLIKVSYDCARCGTMLLDVARSGRTNEELKQLAQTTIQCTCGHAGTSKIKYKCGYDPTGMYQISDGCASQNKEPEPMSIFDCVVFIYRQGEQQQSEIVVSAIPQKRFNDPTTNKPLDLNLPHLSKTFDLNRMYAPLDIAKQAEICGVQNPYAPQQQQMFAPYPNQPTGGMPQQQGGYPNPYGQPPQQTQLPYPSQQPQQQGNYQQPAQQNQFPQGGVPFSGRPNYNQK